MRISHNLVIDHFRKGQKMPMLRDSEEFSVFSMITEVTQPLETYIITEQIENDLNKLIKELPEDQKEVLYMRIYQDYSFKEISEMTGVSVNTALGRMRYAVMNLRKLVEKNQIVLTS